MQKSKIEWLRGGYTWNPIKMRCTPVGEGCKNCWHIRMSKRHAGHTGWKYHKAITTGPPMLDKQELDAPRRLKNPTIIAPQLMGDLFHANVKDADIAAVMQTINECPQHTFLLLTKRYQRMADVLQEMFKCFCDGTAPANLWLGVSVWDRESLQNAVPSLSKCSGFVNKWQTWISAEPLLNDLGGIYYGVGHHPWIPKWVVCGAETGQGRRPMPMDAYKRLRDQCGSLDIPFFGKVGNNGENLAPRNMPEMEKVCPQ